MEMNDKRVIHITEVWYVPISDVQSVVEVSGQAVVTLKNEKAWAQLYFTPGTAVFEEAHSDEGRAWAYKQRFSASIPGEDADNTEWIDQYHQKPVLLKLLQNNGIRLLGSLDIPCRIKIIWNIKETGTTIQVDRKSKIRAMWTA